MKFTKENCLGDDYGKAFAMALLEKSGLEIDFKETCFDCFTGVNYWFQKFIRSIFRSAVTNSRRMHYVHS